MAAVSPGTFSLRLLIALRQTVKIDRPLQGRLPALAEGNRLPAMIRLAMAQQQVGQVHGEERIAERSGALWRE